MLDHYAPDLNLVDSGVLVLLQVHVDWEMCVHISHLVLVTLGDANDQVVDESADGSESGDVLAVAVVEFDVDDVLRWVREGNRQMTQVLRELSAWTLDGDLTGLDVDLDSAASPSVHELVHLVLRSFPLKMRPLACAALRTPSCASSVVKVYIPLWNLQRLL